MYKVIEFWSKTTFQKISPKQKQKKNYNKHHSKTIRALTSLTHSQSKIQRMETLSRYFQKKFNVQIKLFINFFLTSYH